MPKHVDNESKHADENPKHADKESHINKDMTKLLLGNKGAILSEMSSLGISVPDGFTISTRAAKLYQKDEKMFEAISESIKRGINTLEQKSGMTFGYGTNPLLLSVRSGAVVSMPGMMDTVLNVGINDEVAGALIRERGRAVFVYDTYRRFMEMYGSVVLGIDEGLFHKILLDCISKYGITDLSDNSYSEDIRIECFLKLITGYKKLIHNERNIDIGSGGAEEVHQCLINTIKAVFKSWSTPRAVYYRNLHNIQHDLHTAVTVQRMVFGNISQNSGSGVVFSRDPSTGKNEICGEYLLNVQGEDVVSGKFNALPLVSSDKESNGLDRVMPDVFEDIKLISKKLERHYKDIQDIEFTIEEGKLWILQSRSCKRSARAALQIAYDMFEEGITSKSESIMQIDPILLDQIVSSVVEVSEDNILIAKGVAASPGAAVGIIALSVEKAQLMAKTADVILVRNDTNPNDVVGMQVSVGIVTANGGLTSHAAVVARGMGKACISGVRSMVLDPAAGLVKIGEHYLKEGDYITVSGFTGEIFLGKARINKVDIPSIFDTIMSWTEKCGDVSVRVNAEVESDVEIGMKFKARGIGLCRTEHMFFSPERIISMRQVIMAENEVIRKKYLEELINFQICDFTKLFQSVAGLPVTIRLLDPPLHEFIPQTEEDLRKFCEDTGSDIEEIRLKVMRMKESNPMLGLRGVRLGIIHPEIYEMQIEAIFKSIHIVKKSSLHSFFPEVEIMIPFVGYEREVIFMKDMISRKIEEMSLLPQYSTIKDIGYKLGIMVEIPRIALQIAKVAPMIDFISFGTNDMTQLIAGISRDDGASFIDRYLDEGIMSNDPFRTIDSDGIGEIIKIAVERARLANNSLKIGVCGEHGGDIQSIAFFVGNNLVDYVSCFPRRVPAMKIAVCREMIRNRMRTDD